MPDYFYMLVFVVNKPDEVQIPAIWETDEDKKLSTFDLKTKYKRLLQSHFQRRQYYNKDIGVWISVSSDCVRQWVKKSRTREKIILIQLMDYLLENSKFIEPPVPDRKKRTEIEHYKHFHLPVFINGKKYIVILKVVKPVNQNHKVYYYSLESVDV
jgi:hypothetical protein